MEETILSQIQQGLTLEGLLLIGQLILAAFVVLTIKTWITKTRALQAFKKSTFISIGSRIRVPVNGIVQFEGTIVSVNKSRVILENNQAKVLMKTSDFMNATWIILNK